MPKFNQKIHQVLLNTLLMISLAIPLWAAPVGDWQGQIQIPGQALDVTIHLTQDPQGNWSGSIDIPQQKATAMPLEQIQVTGKTISFRIAGVPGNPLFKGTLSEGEESISGQFSQGGQSFDFKLQQASSSAQTEAQIQAQAEADALQKELRNVATTALKEWKTPGFALALVKDGKVILSEGFGWRDADKKLPVTAQTLFAIGSSSKAFTATSLAILADQGKLEWDQPVKNYLHDFELQDPIATQQATALDLLTHRIGLPRHDLSWYGSFATRRELFASLKYLEPTLGFREGFQYQNLMYMTAGVLLEELSGQSWEHFVQTHIFDPLDMTRSNSRFQTLISDPDHSLGYQVRKVQNKDVVQAIPARNIEAIGPAGSIHSTISDMTKWLQFQLGDGSINGKSILEKSNLQNLHQPHQIVSSQGLPEVPYTLYGLGWFVQPYRGHTLVQHGGNIDGYTAMVSLMPHENSGIVILSNLNGDSLPTALMYNIYDRLLKLTPIEWNQRLKGHQSNESLIQRVDLPQVPWTKPSHELKAYIGSFQHPAYGIAHIKLEQGNLTLDFRDLGGKLKHWHYDQFRIDSTKSIMEGLSLKFNTNDLGEIDALEMSLQVEAAPIRFALQADSKLSSITVLQQYVGTYDLAGITVTFYLQNNHLMTRVAGQEPYELVAYRENVYQLKKLPGYQVHFELNQGNVVAAQLIQPNGAFRAVKLTK